MRRALVGIVPEELLNRKRKAYITRGPLASIAADWASLERLTRTMVSESLGIVNGKLFLESLEKARQGHEVPLVFLMRTLGIESWLGNLKRGNCLVESLTRHELPVHVSVQPRQTKPAVT